jgi:hypothetical protein
MITNREPIVSNDRPAWHYLEPGSQGRTMTYTMGSMAGIPTMALFIEPSNEPIFIPVHVMLHCVDWAEEQDALDFSKDMYRMFLDENGFGDGVDD